MTDSTDATSRKTAMDIFNRMLAAKKVSNIANVGADLEALIAAAEEISSGSAEMLPAVASVVGVMIDTGGITDLSEVAERMRGVAQALTGASGAAPAAAPKQAKAPAAPAAAQHAQPKAAAKPDAAKPRAQAPAEASSGAEPPSHLRGAARKSWLARHGQAAPAQSQPKAAPAAEKKTAPAAAEPPSHLRGAARKSWLARHGQAPATEAQTPKASEAPKAAASKAPASHQAKAAASAQVSTAQHTTQEPAVPPRESVKGDHIICLEDGKKMKMLKRHLRTTYNMTPEQYRQKWNLPPDYPMVAPLYAKQKSRYAKSIGLGSTKMRSEVAAKRQSVEA